MSGGVGGVTLLLRVCAVVHVALEVDVMFPSVFALDESMTPRVLAYSGGWAVLRGDDVIASYTTLIEALLRQMEEQE